MDDTLLSRCEGVPYVIVEKQGLIWAWGEPHALASNLNESTIPTCDALDDPEFTWIDVSRDMPYSADVLLENVLDSSHVPFTHHQTISKRSSASPLALSLTTQITPLGFEGKNEEAAAFRGLETERTSSFVAPTYMHHRIRTAGGSGSFETWTVAYATPAGPGRSRLMARFPFRFPEPKWGLINVPRLLVRILPDWLNHIGQLRVLDDDGVFLPLQEQAVKEAGGWRGNYALVTAADV
jgi:phenylpropionate dioxygenase-like ring-hydroxylating dioxygenase large terminal subunit